MATGSTAFPLGQQVVLKGHFDRPVLLEEARPLGTGYECRVRLADGTLDEVVISAEEASSLRGQAADQAATVSPVDAEKRTVGPAVKRDT